VGALITQETLGDHELIAAMAKNKCRTLFAGIESLDPEFLDAHNKRDSLDRGELRPGLRLRDLDGMAIAYRDCVSSEAELSEFARKVHKRSRRAHRPPGAGAQGP